MPSNQDTKNDPHDMLEIAPDVVLVARAAAEFPSLAPDTVSQPFGRQPNMGNMGAEPDLTAAPRVDARFRASDVNDIPGLSSSGRWMRRAAMAFLFAFISVFATAAWQRYGDDAQAIAAGLTSQVDFAAWLPWQKSDAATPADTSAPPVDTSAPSATASVAAAADQATPSAAAPADAPATPAAVAPAAAPPSPPAQDPAQTVQSVSRDVASLAQQIETLKASIAELKASQEQLSQQLSREVAKPRAAEARPPEARPVEHHPAKLGAPPRPLGTIVQRNPRPPMYPPMQATAAAPLPPPGSLPVQISPGPPPAAASDASDDGVVVRPPMPVR